MRKAFLAGLFTFAMLFCSGFAMADDCGNNKDNGKGTPSCGTTGQPAGSPVVINNDNLSNIRLTNKNNNSNTATSTSSSNSSANSTAASRATASQSQVANGGSATATNGDQSNSQVSTFNQVHQTPLAIAPEAANTTAPCRVAGSGAGSSPFFGLSFSGSRQDTECEKRATALAFAQLGAQQAAIEVLCSTKAAKSADVEVCKSLEAFKKVAATTPAPVTPGVQQ
jgi:hypothetical protein